MGNAPEFPKLDSATPEFWDVRYRADFMPWDAGAVPLQVRQFVAAQAQPLRTLVPGCGSGHEIACFAAAGWDVMGVDFSPAALERARRRLGEYANRTTLGDFFTLPAAPPYDALYERTFLCALKPTLRPAYADQAVRLLSPGGLLFGYFYYGEKPGGPPFGISLAELEQLLLPHFERQETCSVPDSLPIFEGKERWEVWRRRG